ncbi:MAG: hypothetical protein AAGC67_10475 [Myxococcota bacterium]
MFNDAPIFLALAEAIGAGRWDAVLAHPFHPGYPAAIAAVADVFAVELESAAVAVSIAGGTLAVLACAFAARRAFDPGLGWLVGITVALHPWAVDFSSDVMSDGLYAGLYLSGIAVLVGLLARPTLGRAVACGGLSGAAYLVRPEGVGLALVAVVLLVARGIQSRARRRATLLASIALVLASAALMAPLLVALSDARGTFTLTQKKSVIALAGGESGAVDVASDADSPAVVAALPLPRSSERVGAPGEQRPSRDLGGAAEALSRALRTSLASFRYEIAVFACVGFFALRRRLDVVREATFVAPALAYCVVLVLLVWGAGYVARRHALAPLLPLTVYAAFGWRTLHEALVDRFAGGKGALRGGSAVAFGLLVALVVVWGARDLRDRRPDRLPVRRAAEWLVANEGEGRVIAAQKLRVAYYARGRFVPLPSGNAAPIRRDLLAQGVEWLVIDEARLDQHRGLAAGLGDWLQIVHVESGAGRRALVLDVR